MKRRCGVSDSKSFVNMYDMVDMIAELEHCILPLG
jgi:hypothetical protein